MIASIPSPSSNMLFGRIHMYGVMIALGVLAGVWLGRRRWGQRGHDPDDMADVAVWAVPAGLIGARLYHVITDWPSRYSGGRWWPDAFMIWRGGLGIPGGIVLGTAAGVIVGKYILKLDVKEGMDTLAPSTPLAQAIGRLGNWFNQELFGRPSNLPWAVEIDAAHRPVAFQNQATYHPTFLYEAVWNLGVVGVLIWIDRKRVLRSGKIFPLYVGLYFAGRFWVESIRIDNATLIGGYRVNTLLSIGMITLSTIWFLWGGFRRSPEDRALALAVPPFSREPVGSDDIDGSDGIDVRVDSGATDEAEAIAESDDGVAEAGPEVDGPLPEVGASEADERDVADGVDPDQGS